jgi:hypothetical protein
MGLENLYKLNTKHDVYHIHKILGALSLFSFIWRAFLWAKYSTAFPEPPEVAAALTSVHGALSLSSLIYRIPNNPNPKIPIIYNDFRTQNIIFSVRSIMAVYCYLFLPVYYSRAAVFAVIMFSAGLSDSISNTPAVRSFPEISATTAAVFQYMNFVSTYAVILGATQPTAAFAVLCPIQMSAFLLTLVKKNIIGINAWIYTYFVIWAGACMIAAGGDSRVMLEMSAVGAYMYIWRIKMQYNKYIGWTHIFIAAQMLQNGFLCAPQLSARIVHK